MANARKLTERMGLLAETEKVHERLLALLDTTPWSGKQVHDANLVATMLVHGIETIVTINTADFARYSEHISVVPL